MAPSGLPAGKGGVGHPRGHASYVPIESQPLGGDGGFSPLGMRPRREGPNAGPPNKPGLNATTGSLETSETQGH